MADMISIEAGWGLRPRADMSRDRQYWKTYTNMMPLGKVGARTLQQVTYPIGSPSLSVSWPNPQLLLSEKKLLMFAGSNFYSVALSDFTATSKSLYAAEEVALNRRFDEDASWTKGAGWTIGSGVATATGAISTNLSQTGILDSSSVYLVTFTMTRSAGSITPTLGTQAGTTRSTTGTFTEEITANGADLKFVASGFTGTIDNVSCVAKVTYTSTGIWNLTAFQDRAWFATNGTKFIWQLPSNPVDASGNDIVQTSGAGLTVQAVGKHDNALVIGGLAGAQLSVSSVAALFTHWKLKNQQNSVTTEDDTLDDSYIMYSEPGGLASDLPFQVFLAALGYPGTYEAALFDGIIRGQIEGQEGQPVGMGFYRPRFAGAIRAIKQLGNELVIYGASGVTRLTRTANGYTENWDNDQDIPGIPIRSFVCGDDKEHYVISNQRGLFRLRPGQPAEFLDYAEYLGNLTASSTVSSWDSLRRYAYFCDGTYAYQWTGAGLGECTAVQPLGLVRLSNSASLYGSHSTANDPTTSVLVGSILSMPNRQTYTTSDMDIVASESDSSTWTANMDVRNRTSDGFRRATPVDVPDRGRTSVNRTGVDQRIYLVADNYKNASLDAVNLNVNETKITVAALMGGTDTILSETNP